MSESRITRIATPDGGAVYTVELSPEAEAVVHRAAKFHECGLEAILGTAISIYVSAFDETVRLAMEARDSGPSH